MNKHYHYFTIKTLACYAGLTEQEAQTVAFYSQQVDDYIANAAMCVKGKPTAYLKDHGYATKLTGDYWIFAPHPTGINVALSLIEHYQKATLAAFHFIPGKSFSKIEQKRHFSRAEYRCLPANDDKAELITQIMHEAVHLAKRDKSTRNLMRLGMALHTYADTFAHCGFSGLGGWENYAKIKKARNQQTNKEEVSTIERALYKTLPAIGHGKVGHVPDICVYDVKMSSRKRRKFLGHAPAIKRKNNEWFMEISKMIFLYLCEVAGTQSQEEQQWEKLYENLFQAIMIPTDNETKTKALTSHWKQYFPKIKYTYSKDSRFYTGNQFVNSTLGRVIHSVTEEFFIYNELACERAEIVLGTKDVLMQNKQMLLQESLNNPVMMTHGCKEQVLIPGQDVSQEQILPSEQDSLRKQASSRNNLIEDNMPETELGMAVYTAGFEYNPEKDIICSTMNNMQRLRGYCRAYDEAAIMISDVIDCEPIYFRYGGYDWMIELWKGQYGIGTGCEIGLYYHQTGEEENPVEHHIMGEMFGCVSDEDMLDLAFSLERNGEELFAQEWTRHWWLTGFRWGEISRPKNLTMNVSIRFPNEEMLQAFINGGIEGTSDSENGKSYGLAAMGYQYTLTGENEISFAYRKPFTKQPKLRKQLGASILNVNRKAVNAYNSMKEKFGIEGNDPDVIGATLAEQDGEEEKELYKTLMKLVSQSRSDLSESTWKV